MFDFGKAFLTNRWFGAPCEDITEGLGPVELHPFTLEKAREAAQMMGFEVLDGRDDLVEENLYISVAVRPTMDGAEDAWIDFNSNW